VKKLMHFLAELFPSGKSGENISAIKAYHRLISSKDKFITFSRKTYNRISGEKTWPPVPGNYKVGAPDAQAAICTLTSNELINPVSKLKGVCIAGSLNTPNLGIEKIVMNCITNPNIRFLLLCGKDSEIFHPGQAILSLFKSGVNDDKRIINAIGPYPVLRNISMDLIHNFRTRIKQIDCRGELDIRKLQRIIIENINQFEYETDREIQTDFLINAVDSTSVENFIEIKPGGKRIPIDYDRKGFFVITVNRKTKTICVKHYYSDNRPGYLIKGHKAQSILLAIIRENLISKLSHAGYLGAELSKAETSLKLDLIYEQDKPLQSI
jgi:tetrahydromethanopterin S-methyltransferase subunit A